MVTKEWGFAGATCHVTGQDREPASWNDLFISGLPVRPDGWVRFLCRPVPQVISQATTGSPVRRYGRIIVAALEETTFAPATH